ncbi:hypothetical protein BDR04DRAFT_1138023 [Suillus decipiens]|nr:hypothetical protein BDR04DRAFT_1138023 [Suillus decipiens]
MPVCSVHTLIVEATRLIAFMYTSIAQRIGAQEHGLGIALANELQRSFAWVHPFTGDSCSSDDEFLAGPESMTDEELLEEFSRFENETLESPRGLQEGVVKVPDIFERGIIDWNEVEKVEGITPAGFIEEIQVDVIGRGSQGMQAVRIIDGLLSSEGIASTQ